MTDASLSDLVRRVASADPDALPRWMLRNDRYAGHLDEREIGHLVAAALADGEQAAMAIPARQEPRCPGGRSSASR